MHIASKFDVAASKDCRVPGIKMGPPNAIFVDDCTDFPKILKESINILIASWSPGDHLLQMIESAPYADLPELNVVLDKARVALLPEMVDHPLGKMLFEKLSPALLQFAHLVPSDRCRVMLMRTLGRTCPLFHVDRLTLRMLCTLRGPGTEWLSNADVLRKGLGHGDNNKIMDTSAVIHQVPRHHICVLKGESFKGNHGNGIVHRSPAVPSHGGGRWYLRVDAD